MKMISTGFPIDMKAAKLDVHQEHYCLCLVVYYNNFYYGRKGKHIIDVQQDVKVCLELSRSQILR